MLDIELCKQLLRLEDDWHVADIKLDEPSHRIDITVRFGAPRKKSLFKRMKKDVPQETITLRHIPLGGYRTYLHVPKPGTVNSNKSWSTGNSPFTQEMEACIVQALNSCRSNTIAAKLLGITAAEAREISERTGAGSEYHEPETPQRIAAPVMADDVVEHQISAHTYTLEQAGNIPVETHKNWQRLINGEIPIQSNAVALQMLLQRVRQQIANNPSEVTRLSSARLLRQYFIKNQSQHPAEISMLTADELLPITAYSAQDASASGIPADSELVWERIVDGELKINTHEMGLQMMLERVRLSVQNNPSDVARISGIRLLRQYFVKHQARLQNEVAQLGGRPVEITETVPAPQMVVGVPAENHPSWNKLIIGEIRLDTNAVGLQMMMERVRQSVERNPSEASKRAGIKILRQFFLKHQNRLQNEIMQLGGSSTGSANEQAPMQMFALPAESHQNWRRLVRGEIPLHTGNVALQMMLERVRLSIEKNPSEAFQVAAVKLLRQFFIKHQSRLQDEIRTLGSQAAPAVSSVQPSTPKTLQVPHESHPSWQRLINGELEIKTDVVALKMMLERIRISIGNNPTDASRLAGARILRQYFLKYQNKHRAEIDQLLAA